MIRTFTLLFVCLTVVYGYSQDVRNMRDQFAYGSAAQRVKACDQLTRYYQAENTDSVRYFGQELFFYGIDNHYYPAIEQGKLSLAVYYVFTGNTAEGIALAKSLLSNMNERRDMRALSKAQGIIAIGYIHQKDVKSSKYWASQAQRSGKEDPDPEVRAESLMAVAEAALLSGKSDQAINVYKNYIRILTPMEKFRSLSAAYARLGDIYRLKGDLALTEKYFGLSEQFARKSKQKLPLAHALNNLAIVEFEKNNLRESLELFTQALKLREEIGDQKSVSESYYNLGDYYYYSGNPAKAKKNYRQSLEVAKKARLLNEVSDAYEQLAAIAKEEKNYEKATGILEEYIKTQKLLQIDQQADDEELSDMQAALVKAETKAELTGGKFSMHADSEKVHWELLVIAILGLVVIYFIFARRGETTT